jgi:4-hydroxybenzoate polyprenyltransferase
VEIVTNPTPHRTRSSSRRKILIKGAYPRLPFSRRSRAFVQLIRPYTIAVPVIAILFGAFGAMYYADMSPYDDHNLIIGVLAALSLAILQASGQVLNQAMDDPALDRRNGKGYRPVASGIISEPEAYMLGITLFGVSLLTASSMVLFDRARATTFVPVILVIFGIILVYQRYLKPILFWDIVALALARGFIPFTAVWLLYAPADAVWLLLSVMFFVHVLGWQNTKDITDIKGDREHGILTLPNWYGTDWTMVCIGITTGVHLILTWWLILYHPQFVLMSVVPVISLVVGTTATRPLKNMENVRGWVWFYLGLTLMYVLLPVSQYLWALV